MPCNICFITLMLTVARLLLSCTIIITMPLSFSYLSLSIFPFFFPWKNNLSSELTMVHFPHKSKLFALLCMCAKLHLTLCDPMDCSPPGFLSMGFSRYEYWSGLPCQAIFQGLIFQGIFWCLLCTLHWQVGSLPLEPPRKPLASL